MLLRSMSFTQQLTGEIALITNRGIVCYKEEDLPRYIEKFKI